MGGTNRIQLAQPAPDVETVSVKTVSPDGVTRVELMHLEPAAVNLVAAFPASMPGDYDVTVHWLDRRSNTVVRAEHFVYHLDKYFKADQELLGETVGELQALGRQVPELGGLVRLFSGRGHRSP